MENYLEPVKEFMRMMDQPILSIPTIPNKDRCDLRYDLIKEELEELKVAYEKNDLVGVLDALCDLQYVLSGAVLEFGMASIFQKAFDEVQRSNMTKKCSTPKEAMDTMEHYREKGVDSYFLKKEDYYLVYRTPGKKVLKSINYSPADLKQFIEKKDQVYLVTSCCHTFSYTKGNIGGINVDICTYCSNPTALVEATKEEIAKHWE